jgi:hypothetical protein
MIRIFALLCAIVPLSARADCPTAGDLANGIILTFPDTNAELYEAGANGDVHVTGFENGAVIYKMELAQGLYLVVNETYVDGKSDDNARTTYAYAEATIPPVPGQNWTSATTVIAGGTVSHERQVHRYGRLESQSVGGCVYDVIPVVITYQGTEPYTEGLAYVPLLGMSFLTWVQEAGAKRQEFPVNTIEAMR